jgi:hypothetical protein
MYSYTVGTVQFTAAGQMSVIYIYILCKKISSIITGQRRIGQVLMQPLQQACENTQCTRIFKNLARSRHHVPSVDYEAKNLLWGVWRIFIKRTI